MKVEQEEELHAVYHNTQQRLCSGLAGVTVKVPSIIQHNATQRVMLRIGAAKSYSRWKSPLPAAGEENFQPGCVELGLSCFFVKLVPTSFIL